jgi:putative PIN family toxin of toxin-antitoxin system
MIVVFDTNVWVSAMHFARGHGAPTRSLAHALQWNTLAICNEIEEEIERILAEKFFWEPAQIRLRLDFLLRHAVRARIAGTVHVCRDPNDDMVLECAERTKAALIVSGDKDLLALDSYQQIPIVTAASYLRIAES